MDSRSRRTLRQAAQRNGQRASQHAKMPTAERLSLRAGHFDYWSGQPEQFKIGDVIAQTVTDP
jgi:hypothetical protein